MWWKINWLVWQTHTVFFDLMRSAFNGNNLTISEVHIILSQTAECKIITTRWFYSDRIFFFLLSCRHINHCGQSHSERCSLEPAFCGVLRVKRQYFTVTPGCLAAEMSCQRLQMQLRKPSHVSRPQLPETQLASSAKCLGTSRCHPNPTWAVLCWLCPRRLCHCQRSPESRFSLATDPLLAKSSFHVDESLLCLVTVVPTVPIILKKLRYVRLAPKLQQSTVHWLYTVQIVVFFEINSLCLISLNFGEIGI